MRSSASSDIWLTGVFLGIFRMDDYWTKQAIIELASAVCMVPVRPVLSCGPSIRKGSTRLDPPLTQTWHPVRPRRAQLFNACGRILEPHLAPTTKPIWRYLPWKCMVMLSGRLFWTKTSTSSPCSISNVGPGKWPFMRTISRAKSSGAYCSQVSFKLKTIAPTVVESHKIEQEKRSL